MAKSIRVIFRIAYLLSDIRLNLIHPYLSYCNIVWPSNYTSRLKRLSVLQRRLSELWQEDPLPPILIINFMTFGFWSLSKLISCKLVNLCTTSPITYFHLLFQVTFLMYQIFILTILDPVKTYAAVLPKQILVCFQLNVLVHVVGIIYLQTFAIFQA